MVADFGTTVTEDFPVEVRLTLGLLEGTMIAAATGQVGSSFVPFVPSRRPGSKTSWDS